ncbi:hypothetical protein B0H11DRAFT_2033971 [Mycena galericulata]|nr:hypothetical protein B0H11DRAFT_2033971 [Mycena galericulata]
MSSTDKKDMNRLILPPPVEGINSNLDHLRLEVFTVADLSIPDEDGTPDPRILIGLENYVFDVSAMKEFFGPTKFYSKYAGKDISTALARFTLDDEVIDAPNYSSLSEKELALLRNWTSLFVKRFEVVGKLER